MTDVLETKRAATRFRILVEIAEQQPAVSQGEIADAVGVTSQAVSEYIRELIEDGYVQKEGRSRYQITPEGVDWLLGEATDVRRFIDHVTEDVLGSVREDAAIATAEIEEGETVTLELQDGLLHAQPGEAGPATGVATNAAGEGEDVGVTGFEGIIDLEPGRVIVLQVPTIRSGGSRSVDTETVQVRSADADRIVASGIEAVVALQAVDTEPIVTVAAGDVAAASAQRGLEVVVAATADRIGRVTDPLREAEITYEVIDAS